MNLPDQIAVSASILAAALYLLRLPSSRCGAPKEDSPCRNCGCGKALLLAKKGPLREPRRQE